jgi:hypothetical protein
VWCDIRWLRRIFKFDRSWNIGFEIHVLYVRHALLSLSFRLTTTGLMTLLLFSGFRLFKGNFIKKLRLKDKITSDQQQHNSSNNKKPWQPVSGLDVVDVLHRECREQRRA